MIDGTSVLAIVIICLIIVLLFIYFRLGRMIDLLGEKKEELEKDEGFSLHISSGACITNLESDFEKQLWGVK